MPLLPFPHQAHRTPLMWTGLRATMAKARSQLTLMMEAIRRTFQASPALLLSTHVTLLINTIHQIDLSMPINSSSLTHQHFTTAPPGRSNYSAAVQLWHCSTRMHALPRRSLTHRTHTMSKASACRPP